MKDFQVKNKLPAIFVAGMIIMAKRGTDLFYTPAKNKSVPFFS